MKLTPRQVAERAGVSPGLIYQWCQEKRLPHFRMGGRGKRGRVLIEDADLDPFLLALKVLAGAAPSSAPASSGPPAGPFSELDPARLVRAWKKG